MRTILVFILCFFVGNVFAAKDSTCLFLVTFKDKKTTTYSLNQPGQFLTAKAIARRVKHNVPVDSLDIPVSEAYIDSVLNTGLIMRSTVRWFNAIVVLAPDSASIYSLNSKSFVKSIKYIGKELSKSRNNSKVATNNNTSIDLGVKSLNYGQSYKQISMIGGDLLHDAGYMGEGIDIAILDAGFYNADNVKQLSHLFANNQIKGTHNFVDNKSDVYRISSGSHGEMVLSIMASLADGDIVGGAPRANYWLLRTEKAENEYISEEYYWAAGAAYADSVGADIINSSLGYTTFDEAWMNHTYADLDGKTAPSSIAATIAARKGILVANSAGNDGNKPWRYIGVPADADSILSIGAVDAQKERASFSSIGNTKDRRIKPDVDAMGQSTFVVSTAGSTMAGSGTSFSSPLIASLSACLLQANPSATNMQMMDAIKKSASQYNTPDSLLGYGIPNYNLANLILKNLNVPKQQASNLINVYPNPFNERLSVLYYSADSQQVVLNVYDVLGAVVYNRTMSLKPNAYYKWDVESIGWNVGLYVVKLFSEEKELFSAKVVK